jgi:hypothetical protein
LETGGQNGFDFPLFWVKVAKMRVVRYMLLSLCLAAPGCYTPRLTIDLQDIHEYQNAADLGNPLAQYHLGAAYESHLRYAEANLWYLRAAKQGVPEAQYALAENYCRGFGLPKNPVEAYAWFTVAGTQANLPSRNARETLAVRLTRSEVEAGDRRAKELLTIVPPQDLLYGETWTAVERGVQYAPGTHGYVGGYAVAVDSANTMRPVDTQKAAVNQTTVPDETTTVTPTPASTPAAPTPTDPVPAIAPAASAPVPDPTPAVSAPAPAPAPAPEAAPAQPQSGPVFQPVSQ